MIKGHLLFRLPLIAIAAIDKVLILSLGDTAIVLYKMENNSGFGLPYLSWGNGSLPGINYPIKYLELPIIDDEDNKDPILAVSWNKVIYLLKVSQNEDGSHLFKVSANFKSSTEIIYMGWISENLILAIDQEKRIKTLYSSLFKNGDGSDPNSAMFNYKKAIMKTKCLDNDLSYQSFLIKDINSSPRNSNPTEIIQTNSLSNTILTFEGTKRIFILCSKNLYIGRLNNWDEYIKNLISKGDWLKSLVLCLDIYQGNIHIC